MLSSAGRQLVEVMRIAVSLVGQEVSHRPNYLQLIEIHLLWALVGHVARVAFSGSNPCTRPSHRPPTVECLVLITIHRMQLLEIIIIIIKMALEAA